MKIISITQNKSTLVDDIDYPILSKYKWFFQKTIKGNGYVARMSSWKNGKRYVIWMHRLILNAPKNFEVDHINHNTLDNRRLNLRLCNRLQNSRNRNINTNNKSGYKGVWFNKIKNKFVTRITIQGKSIYGGYYDSSTEAAKSYNELAKKYYKDFSRLNFI